MSKRLLSALLAVVMVATMIVVPAYATEEVQTQQAGYCQHCKTVVPEEQWLPWDTTNLGPRTGHYYLANDIADQTQQITINLDDDLARNKVCLDLRGRSYTVTGLRPFLIYGIFSIMDSVGNAEIAVTGASNANGGFAQMGMKSGCIDGAGELNVYGGTIRRINTTTDTVSYGGLIYIATGATLNVYGGTLVGGEVKARIYNSNAVGPMGGTIYCTGSNVNLYGGVVTGGVSKDGSVTINGKTTKFEATGGNIYAQGKSVITIDGGKLINGYSETYGGNITFKDSTLNLISGSIEGGYTDGAAGNIYASGSSKLNISGGVLKDGVAVTRGGNLFVNNQNMDINISGGEIYGDLSVGLFKSFVLSGAPKIYMGNSNGLRLQRATDANAKLDKKIDISGLTEGAEIYLDGDRHDPVFTEVLDNPEAYLGYFKDAIRADISVDESGALKVEQGTTGYCPHCWQTGEQATWEAFTHTADSNKTVTSQHAYLTGNVTRTRLLTINDGIDFVIDTASKSFNITNYKFANLYGTLSIIDSVGSGYIASTGHPNANGGVIMGSGSAVFNMYSGTLKRTVTSGEERKGVLLGGILYAPADTTVNIYGGTIRDGISDTTGSTATPKGGNIDAMGKFNMSAGALIGGKAFSTEYVKNNTEDHTVDKNGKNTTLIGVGGNLYLAGEANITGGHIVGGNATQGGNIYISSSAQVSIDGASIRDGVADRTNGLLAAETKVEMRGGNVFVTDSASTPRNVNISNSLLVNGTAREQGGNLYVTVGKVTLDHSLLTGGIAGTTTGDDGRGGNVYLSGTGKLDICDSILGNGYAMGHGGNLYGPGGVDVKMYSGVISGGTAKNYGGNMYCSGLTMYSGVITGGTSESLNGGNIFVYETTIKEGVEPTYNYLTITAVEGKPAPIISNGTSSSFGGNITVSKNSLATISGAIIENGKGDTGNKTAGYDADNLYIRTGTVVALNNTQIRGIADDENAGNAIYADGQLILQGNTTAVNESKHSCVFITGDGSLTVDASFSGEVVAAFGKAHFENAAEPQGGTLAEQDTATGVFSGKLYLDSASYNYGLPAVFAEEGDSKLYIASTAVVDPVNNTFEWYRDSNVAVAALTSSNYLKLFKTENTLTVNGDMVIDLNGNSLSVTGEGTIYGFDSKNDDYTTYGQLTTTDSQVAVAPMHTAPNGRRYIAVESETGATFHRLGIAVTDVILRPSAAGIYYKATWECDEVLQAEIDSFGIAVSTNDMPGLDFATDSDTLYTTMNAESFVSGQAVSSAMIENVLVEGEDNAARGNQPIYAAPYAVVGDLTIIGDDNAPTMGGVIYSMKTVLQPINRAWYKLSESQKQGIRDLYALDAEVIKTWDLYNITAAIEGTPAIRPLKILTLGHSLAVDSGHMLNLVADAEGYDQPMEIATLYYSGCPLYKHVNYIKGNSAVYELYLSSTTTPGKPPVITKGVTMEYGVKYMDWDIIIMQGGVFEIAYDEKYQDGNIQFIQNYVDSIKTNPNAIYAWHMPWACPTDTTLRDMYPYSPNTYYTSYEALNNDRTTMYNAITGAVGRNIVTDDSFIYLIPSGTAIENALSSYLVEKDLHRDYVHVSDLGRVISSYTWYCTLAGINHLDEIKLDAIPKAFFKSTTGTTDRVLTDMEKAIILESVNNALANPLQMTQSQYTVAP